MSLWAESYLPFGFQQASGEHLENRFLVEKTQQFIPPEFYEFQKKVFEDLAVLTNLAFLFNQHSIDPDFLEKPYLTDCLFPEKMYQPRNGEGYATGVVLDPLEHHMRTVRNEMSFASRAYGKYVRAVRGGARVISLGIGDGTKELGLLSDSGINPKLFLATDRYNPRDRILASNRSLANADWLHTDAIDLSSIPDLIRLEQYIQRYAYDCDHSPYFPPLVITLCSVLSNMNGETQIKALDTILESLPANGSILFSLSTTLNPAYYYGQEPMFRLELFKRQVLSVLKLKYRDFPIDQYDEIDMGFMSIIKSDAAKKRFGLDDAVETIASPLWYCQYFDTFHERSNQQFMFERVATNVAAAVIGRTGMYNQGFWQCYLQKCPIH